MGEGWVKNMSQQKQTECYKIKGLEIVIYFWEVGVSILAEIDVQHSVQQMAAMGSKHHQS